MPLVKASVDILSGVTADDIWLSCGGSYFELLYVAEMHKMDSSDVRGEKRRICDVGFYGRKMETFDLRVAGRLTQDKQGGHELLPRNNKLCVVAWIR